MVSLRFIQKGNYCEISALERNKRCDYQEFIDQLKRSDKTTYSTILTMMERIADSGHPRNKTQFRQLRSNLYEIKVKHVRLFCFYHNSTGRVIVLTHGWSKGSRKVQRQQIDRAEQLRDEYLNQ